MDFRLDIGGYGITSKGCRKTTDKKLSVHDWMSDLPETEQETDFVEGNRGWRHPGHGLLSSTDEAVGAGYGNDYFLYS